MITAVARSLSVITATPLTMRMEKWIHLNFRNIVINEGWYVVVETLRDPGRARHWAHLHQSLQSPSDLCVARRRRVPRQMFRFYHSPACEEATETNEENWHTQDYLQQCNLCGGEIWIASDFWHICNHLEIASIQIMSSLRLLQTPGSTKPPNFWSSSGPGVIQFFSRQLHIETD